MAEAYTPINWQNGKTPINEDNLNHMDNAIKVLYDEGATSKDIFIGNEEDAPKDAKIVIDTDSFATTGTEVVKSLSGNETNKAPSVKAVNDKFDELNVYSTEERQIGWWEYSDGARKPIYRKNFSGTFKDEQTILDDIDMVLVYGGIAYISSLGRIVPYYEIFNGNVYAFRITKKGNQINTIVFEEGNPITADAEFYVEYTKTTDAPISISEGADEK